MLWMMLCLKSVLGVLRTPSFLAFGERFHASLGLAAFVPAYRSQQSLLMLDINTPIVAQYLHGHEPLCRPDPSSRRAALSALQS
jgi:hypothetical protein